MTEQDDFEARALASVASWEAWARPDEAWPVSEAGKGLVAQAVEIHRDFFSDSWLKEMSVRGQNPFVNLYAWPLSGHPQVVRLIERASRIELLPPEARARLSADIQASYELPFFIHLEVELETAGLAIRDGWGVEVERELASGKKPDLRLQKGSVEYSVEVSLLTMDRKMRAVNDWHHKLSMIKLVTESAHGVTIAGQADDTALTESEIEDLRLELDRAAAATHLDGVIRTVRAPALMLTVGRSNDPETPTTFTGPPQQGDPIGRLLTRIRTKANQTAGGPPAWIRVDEVGGLFQLTQWAQGEIEQQLGQLHDVLIDTLREFSHLRGIVLTDGSDPWGGALEEVTCQRRDYPPMTGPLAIVRRLPHRGRRRSFIIPNDIRRIELPTGLELNPGHWYADEGRWLDWALHKLGWPTLDRTLAEPTSPARF